MWSCLLFLSLPVYSCKFLSQPLGSFVLAPSPLRNDRNIYRKSHAWIYSRHKSLPRKIVSFSVKTIRPQKNWEGPRPICTPIPKVTFLVQREVIPTWYQMPMAHVWPLPEKELFVFLGLQFLQVFSNEKWCPSPESPPKISIKNSHKNNNQKMFEDWKNHPDLSICYNSFFSGWTGIFGENKSLPTPMSHLSSPYAALWVRMSGLGRPGRGEIHQDLVQFHSANLDDQPAWPKTFLSWDGVKKPGLLWWNWPFSKRAIWYVQPLLYNEGRVCLGSGGFIVLP